MTQENGTGLTTVPASGMVARDEFGARQLARTAETATTALAAQAQAEVQARYIMAERRPRNDYDARAKMLKSCERPSFAQVAVYRKPLGGGKQAEGLSIRFAEMAMRAWGNIHVAVMVTSDDLEKRMLRVTATDLEANVSESMDLVIEKTVERKFLKDGQIAIRSRLNSYGELVHLIPANEGEFLTKQAAEAAKARRQCIVHLIPGDILDECKMRIFSTQANEDARDPDAAKKAVCDGFSAIGVSASELEKYLGHALDATSPPELGELRAVYAAIRDSDATWNEVLAAKIGGADGKADPKLAEVKNKVKARVEAQKGKSKPGPQKSPEAAKPHVDEATGEVTGEQREPGVD